MWPVCESKSNSHSVISCIFKKKIRRFHCHKFVNVATLHQLAKSSLFFRCRRFQFVDSLLSGIQRWQKEADIALRLGNPLSLCAIANIRAGINESLLFTCVINGKGFEMSSKPTRLFECITSSRTGVSRNSITQSPRYYFLSLSLEISCHST